MTHAEIEIGKLEIREGCAWKNSIPTVVVNTAAMHHVEICEQETQRRPMPLMQLASEIFRWSRGILRPP